MLLLNIHELYNEKLTTPEEIAARFRPGDVINRINGEELTNPELLFSMLQKIDEINAVSIDITRGGEKKTLFVEIQ